MAEIDHLVFAAPDLDEGADRIERLLGIRAMSGGSHPGWGTRNALVALGPTTYLEIIGVDPDQDEPDRPRPFGLDDVDQPRLASFALHPAPGETIEQVATRLSAAGFDPGEIAPMSRQTPDGRMLEWNLTTPREAHQDGHIALPFLIDWGSTPSPAATAPIAGTLDRLIVAHPDSAIRAAIGDLVSSPPIETRATDDAPGLVAVISTPAGRVELR